jgi:hypothetical protein
VSLFVGCALAAGWFASAWATGAGSGSGTRAAAGDGALALATGFRRAWVLARCSARIASSNVMPSALSCPAAGLLPSPTIAARTIAPSIWRRFDCCAAEAAACNTRSNSVSGRGSAPFSARMSSISRPRYPDTSVLNRLRSTLAALRMSEASGSSVKASSRCSSVTRRCDCSRAKRCARSRLSPRLADIGSDLNSSAIDCAINEPPRSARPHVCSCSPRRAYRPEPG